MTGATGDNASSSDRDPPSVCLVCRVVLDPDQRCDRDKTHEVVDLATEPGREALRQTVWRPRSLTHRQRLHGGLTRRAKRLIDSNRVVLGVPALPLLVGLVALVVSHFARSITFFLVGVTIVLLTVASRYLLRHLARPLLPPEESPIPHGAAESVPAPDAPLRTEGIAEGRATLVAPLSEQTCLGFGVVVRATSAHGGPVMLLEGRCGPFDLLLDDRSKLLQVPASRVRFLFTPQRERPFSVDALEPYLQSHHARWLLAPGDMLGEVQLMGGDRVAVHASLVETTDEARAKGYRDVARVLIPRGPIDLELIGGALEWSDRNIKLPTE